MAPSGPAGRSRPHRPGIGRQRPRHKRIPVQEARQITSTLRAALSRQIPTAMARATVWLTAWLHEPSMYFERQTQLGDIPWPGEGSAGMFLDSAQPMADRVRVTNKYLS